MSDQYNVIFKGEILDGFKLGTVRTNFAKVFKLEPGKLETYFSGKAITLRRKVDHKTAYKFKSALAKFGASVELRRIAQDVTPALSEMSLVPMEEKAVEQSEQGAIKNENNEDFLTSPGQQAVVQSDLHLKNTNDENIAEEDISVVEGSSFGSGALMASIAAAIVGAFVWKFIAVMFDYELGLIAWGIGGGIGFAAAMFGSRGQTAGIICGVLALLSIFGGKYLTYASLKDEFTDTVVSQPEDLREVYNAEKAIAEMYASTVIDEESQKQFMVDYGYSYSEDPEKISDSEINDFMTATVPRLEGLADNSISFEEWSKGGFQDLMGNFSTFDLVKDSFDLLDILFLFFGIGTAYRLASKE